MRESEVTPPHLEQGGRKGCNILTWLGSRGRIVPSKGMSAQRLIFFLMELESRVSCACGRGTGTIRRRHGPGGWASGVLAVRCEMTRPPTRPGDGRPPCWHRRRGLASCRTPKYQEMRRGERHCEVVQSDQGLWVHPTVERRQGRVRAHQRGRTRRAEHAQRRATG